MEAITHVVQPIIHNGFTWRNIVGIIFAIWIGNNTFRGFKTGVMDTMWNSHTDIRNAKILFCLDVIFMLFGLFCMMFFALGFANQPDDWFLIKPLG